VKVAYIAGAPRSGSTLLALALGERPGFFAIGELSFVWEKGVLESQLCGCGRPFMACDFWSAVGTAAFGGWENVDAAAMMHLRASVDKGRFVPLILVPWVSPRFRARAKRYTECLEKVYLAVAQVSGCDVVVDSSKTPSFALLLRYMREVRPSVIHLIRDSRGVAYSWSKRSVRRPEFPDQTRYMNTFAPHRSSALWLWYNLPLHACRIFRIPRTAVRYEDMATNLEAELDRVQRRIVGDAAEGAPPTPGVMTFSVHHTISGNRVRFSDRVEVRLDDEWRRRMPRSSRVVVGFLTGPLLWGYGYLGRARRHVNEAPTWT
jgi:Sulfotransferase domain